MEKSIYDLIREDYKVDMVLPYNFQDFKNAGRLDFETVFNGEDDLSISEKEEVSKRLIDEIRCIISCEINEFKLIDFFVDFPFVKFFKVFSRILSAYVDEEIFDNRRLYYFGLKLSTKSKYTELVKLGIIILGNFENDYSKRIISNLGYHSEFTLYSIEAISNFSGANIICFDFLKNTDGYGRLVSLNFFQSIKDEYSSWIVKNIKYTNGPIKHSICTIILESLFTKTYIGEMRITEDNFSDISFIIAYASLYGKVKTLKIGSDFFKRYVDFSKKYATSLIDLLAMTILFWRIKFGFESDDIEIKNNPSEEFGWTEDLEKEILEVLKKEIVRFDYETLILEYIIETESLYEEDMVLVMEVLKALKYIDNYLIDVDFFDIIFARSPFLYQTMEYFLIENSSVYYDNIYNRIPRFLPYEVFIDEMNEDPPSYKYIPDFSLIYLIEAFVENDDYNEDFFIRCLFARFKDVRIEANKALKFFKSEWSENVRSRIEKAIELEPSEKIKKYLHRLIGTNNRGAKKEFIDIETLIKEEGEDVVLIYTNLAGKQYRDLSELREVKRGDVLYLKREPENEYDENAILVADAQGLVIGYVSRYDNNSIASMMDNNFIVYAILEDDDLDGYRPNIVVKMKKN